MFTDVTVRFKAVPKELLGNSAVLLLAVAAGLIVVSIPEQWLPDCTIHRLTGIRCIGCGATRALRAIVRGDLLAAFRFNFLFTGLGLVVIAETIADWSWVLIGKMGSVRLTEEPWFGRLVAGSVCTFLTVRIIQDLVAR